MKSMFGYMQYQPYGLSQAIPTLRSVTTWQASGVTNWRTGENFGPIADISNIYITAQNFFSNLHNLFTVSIRMSKKFFVSF